MFWRHGLVLAPRSRITPAIAVMTLVAAAVVLRAFIAGESLLSGDEAYYWLWSRRLQLSYYDHPGMLAWWMRASTGLFGATEWAIRLPAVLSSALVSLMVFDSVRLAFKDEWGGFWAALWLNVTILFGASAVTATPDTPLLVFWAGALWCLVRLLVTGRAVWIYGLGMALGLGFCSKYTMVLSAPGIIAGFVLFPQGRRWLRSPHFYLAILLAVLCTAPVMVWNYTHDWVSFRKQLAHSFATPVSDPVKSASTFLATQLGVVTPLILGFALWGMGWSLWAGWRRQRPEWFLLGAVSLPVLIFFAHHSFSGLVQPHWAGPAYLGGIMAAVGGWRTMPRPSWLNRMYWAAPILAAFMLVVAYVQMATAILPLPPRLDALSRLGGWDRLAQAVDEERSRHPDAFVFVEKHELSGLMTYYLHDHPKAILTGSAGIPRIPSYDAQDVAGLKGRDGLFVVRAGSDGPRDSAKFFDRISLVRQFDRVWGGRVIDHYEVWLGEAYRGGNFEDDDNLMGRGPQ